MKTIITFGIFILAFLKINAQDEALFQNKVHHGIYGGPLVEITDFYEGTGVLAGFKGGWILNNKFVLGAKFHMLTDTKPVAGLQNIVFGYFGGGAYMEYISNPSRLFHYSFEMTIGPCMVYNDLFKYAFEHDPIEYTSESGMLFEPGFNLMVNVTQRFRCGIGTTWRFVQGINYDAGAPWQSAEQDNYATITADDLSGLSAQVFVKFGLF